MANMEAGAGAAETVKEETMALEEEAVAAKMEEAEEVKEATPTTTMQKEVVAASMEAEAAEDITDTINNQYQGSPQHTQSHFQQPSMPSTVLLPYSVSRGSPPPAYQSHHMDSYTNQVGHNANSSQ